MVTCFSHNWVYKEASPSHKLQNLPRRSHLPHMKCQENKLSTGCSLYHTPCLRPTCRQCVLGFEDNLSSLSPGSSTGKSWSPSPRKSLYPEFEKCLDPSTPKCQDQPLLVNTFGKKKRESKGRVSKLEQYLTTATKKETGMQSGSVPSPEICLPYQQLYEFRGKLVINLVTAPSEQLLQTLQNQLEWSELAKYSGVLLERASRGELGKKQEMMLTVKTRGPNSGAATLVRQMLCSMNFEEELMSRTCSVGSIDILSLWKSKDPVYHWSPIRSGSPPTYIPEIGTPNWT